MEEYNSAGMDCDLGNSDNLSILLSHPYYSFDKISHGFNLPTLNHYEMPISPPTENNTNNVLMESFDYKCEPVTTRPINDCFPELAVSVRLLANARHCIQAARVEMFL